MIDNIVSEGLDKFGLSNLWLYVVAEDVCNIKFPRRYAACVNHVYMHNEVQIGGLEYEYGPCWFNDYMDNETKYMSYLSIGSHLAKILQKPDPDIQLDIDEKSSLGKLIVNSKKRRNKTKPNDELIAPKLNEKADWYELYQTQNYGYTEIGLLYYKGDNFDEETRFINKVKRGVHWYAKNFNLPLRDGRKYISKGISRKKD